MREDRESGRGRENERGRKSMGTGGYEMEELVPIVAKLAEQYTGHESTSVTYEKANQLMTACLPVIFPQRRHTSLEDGLWMRRSET